MMNEEGRSSPWPTVYHITRTTRAISPRYWAEPLKRQKFIFRT